MFYNHTAQMAILVFAYIGIFNTVIHIYQKIEGINELLQCSCIERYLQYFPKILELCQCHMKLSKII